MPLFGRQTAYLDEKMRVMLPVASNARYQLRWLDHWTREHGGQVQAEVTYGSLSAPFSMYFHDVGALIDRM